MAAPRHTSKLAVEPGIEPVRLPLRGKAAQGTSLAWRLSPGQKGRGRPRPWSSEPHHGPVKQHSWDQLTEEQTVAPGRGMPHS